MEFKSGTVPYEAPPLEWKNHVRRKHITGFRTLDVKKTGVIHRKDTLIWAQRAAEYYPDPEEKQKTMERQMANYDSLILFGRDSVTEKEYVDEWVRRVYSESEERKKYMEDYRKGAKIVFDPIDTNKNGVIDEDEFFAFYGVYGTNPETTKALFDHIDADKNGTISFDEFSYSMIHWVFNSGPDDIASLWAGPLVKD